MDEMDKIKSFLALSILDILTRNGIPKRPRRENSTQYSFFKLWFWKIIVILKLIKKFPVFSVLSLKCTIMI